MPSADETASSQVKNRTKGIPRLIIRDFIRKCKSPGFTAVTVPVYS